MFLPFPIGLRPQKEAIFQEYVKDIKTDRATVFGLLGTDPQRAYQKYKQLSGSKGEIFSTEHNKKIWLQQKAWYLNTSPNEPCVPPIYGDFFTMVGLLIPTVTNSTIILDFDVTCRPDTALANEYPKIVNIVKNLPETAKSITFLFTHCIRGIKKTQVDEVTTQIIQFLHTSWKKISWQEDKSLCLIKKYRDTNTMISGRTVFTKIGQK